jgi:hypothetical protein
MHLFAMITIERLRFIKFLLPQYSVQTALLFAKSGAACFFLHGQKVRGNMDFCSNKERTM